MIRHKPTGQFRLKNHTPKLAKPGEMGRVYAKKSHAQAILSEAAHLYTSELRYRQVHPEWYERRPEMHQADLLRNPDVWEIVEFDLTEVVSAG